MKKILTMCMALALILAMAVPAYAYDGSAAARTSTSWWDWWSHFIPSNPTLPSDPTEPSAPETAELGVTTIVANYYPPEKSPAKRIADEQWDVDFSQVDNMVARIKEHHVDGIFVGWTDSHLPYYAEICEKAGLPCCGTVEQFDILSNDKRRFKQTCIEYGVPTIPEYKMDIQLLREDLDKIEYPVMVKPADESGSRGVRRAHGTNFQTR